MIFTWLLTLAFATDCPLTVDSQLLLSTQMDSNDNLKTRNQKASLRMQLTQKYVNDLADLYLSQKATSKEIIDCLEQKNLEVLDIPSKFSKALFYATAAKLSTSKSKLSQTIAKITQNNQTLVFQAFTKELPNSRRRAEVSRSSGFISASLKLMTQDEWPLLFIHEVLHRKDQTLESSIPTYNNAENISRMLEILKQYQTWEELSTDDQAFMLKQLEAGFNRGFLAEFRAWAYSFQVYQEWREHNEIASIAWADEVLKHKSERQNMADFIYSYLRPRFTDPTGEGIHQSQIWQTAYQLKFKELDRTNKTKLLQKAFPDLPNL